MFVTAGVALALTVVTTGPALADTVSSDLRSGSNGDVVGTVSFERTVGAGGVETLHVVASVPGGSSASHLCLGTQAFTDRVSPGQCPYSNGGGTSITYTVNLGTTYASHPLYIQFHVDLGGASAYAGWQDGKPFFGNLVADAPDSLPTPVPVGAVGAVILAAITGLAFLIVQRRTSRRHAATTPPGS